MTRDERNEETKLADDDNVSSLDFPRSPTETNSIYYSLGNENLANEVIAAMIIM